MIRTYADDGSHARYTDAVTFEMVEDFEEWAQNNDVGTFKHVDGEDVNEPISEERLNRLRNGETIFAHQNYRFDLDIPYPTIVARWYKGRILVHLYISDPFSHLAHRLYGS